MSPLCESYVDPARLNAVEPFYPLHTYVCEACWLVQLEEFVTVEEIFSHYAYFSSYSDSWLEHCKSYVGMIVERLALGADSLVLELASNDGYLLQYFHDLNVPVLGVEPAANVAEVATGKGIETIVDFFGPPLAAELVAKRIQPDLIIGNNVLAQVPDLNGFVAAMRTVLKPSGVITLEFPHLVRLIDENQFDTIYHEHFSYFSLTSVERIFSAHGLKVFDVDELRTHGGSLRIYAGHADDDEKTETVRLSELRRSEAAAGVEHTSYYDDFADRVAETRYQLLEFLIRARREGKVVAAYGAPGKGNTLLNYCGIRADLVAFTVDRSPFKQGKFLPGTHIPIFAPDQIFEVRPDYVLILPWNLKDEIMSQLHDVREWGGQFVVAIPEPSVVP
jgi:SAM-dependent methyltransferase